MLLEGVGEEKEERFGGDFPSAFGSKLLSVLREEKRIEKVVGGNYEAGRKTVV